MFLLTELCLFVGVVGNVVVEEDEDEEELGAERVDKDWDLDDKRFSEDKVLGGGCKLTSYVALDPFRDDCAYRGLVVKGTGGLDSCLGLGVKLEEPFGVKFEATFGEGADSEELESEEESDDDDEGEEFKWRICDLVNEFGGKEALACLGI